MTTPKLLKRHRDAIATLAKYPEGAAIDETYAAGRKLALAVRELQMDFDLAEYSTDSEVRGFRGRRLTAAGRALAARPNYWSAREANGDTDERRCIHGVPLNCFCEKCEG